MIDLDCELFIDETTYCCKDCHSQDEDDFGPPYDTIEVFYDNQILEVCCEAYWRYVDKYGEFPKKAE